MHSTFIPPKLRVGLSHFNEGPLVQAVRALRAPVLVSANALARKHSDLSTLSDADRDWYRHYFMQSESRIAGSSGFERAFEAWLRLNAARFVGFREWPESLKGLDVALDSAGFVAMSHYKQYLWGMLDYLRWAERCDVEWVAAMDLCVEPEIAQGFQVQRRIALTAQNFKTMCRHIREQGFEARLMPVLQGWHASDYLRTYELLGAPDGMVGLGSFCRRDVNGGDGILEILRQLDEALPVDVTFHLFGVKSQGLAQAFREYPHRVRSADSQAWDFAASKSLYAQGLPKTQANRATFLSTWYQRQQRALKDAAADLEQGLTVQDTLFGYDIKPVAATTSAFADKHGTAVADLQALVAEGELDDFDERWAYEMAGWEDEEAELEIEAVPEAA